MIFSLCNRTRGSILQLRTTKRCSGLCEGHTKEYAFKSNENEAGFWEVPVTANISKHTAFTSYEIFFFFWWGYIYLQNLFLFSWRRMHVTGLDKNNHFVFKVVTRTTNMIKITELGKEKAPEKTVVTSTDIPSVNNTCLAFPVKYFPGLKVLHKQLQPFL